MCWWVAVAANPVDVDELLERLQPRRSTVLLCLDRGLVQEHAEVENQLKQVVQGRGTDLESGQDLLAEQLADRLVELETRLGENQVEFVFESVGARRWADLLAEHPPTKDQRMAIPNVEFNPDTFPAAVVALSACEPKLSLAQARALESQLTVTEWSLLWGAALEANIGGDAVPKSILAGSIRRQSGTSATMRAVEESLDQSS